MSYTVGRRSVNRRLLLDCNDGKTWNSQKIITTGAPSLTSQPLQSTFEFSLWQDTYLSKVLLKNSSIPYTFFNTLSPTQGVKIYVAVSFANPTAPTDIYHGVQQFQPQWYQLSPLNFTEAIADAVLQLNNGAAAPSVLPILNMQYDGEDQQLGITPTTMGRDASNSRYLTSMLVNLVVEFDPLVVTLEQGRTLVGNIFGQVANPNNAAGETLGAASLDNTDTEAKNSYILTVVNLTGLAENVVQWKPEIMNFVTPPYILIHTDFMPHSLVKPAVIASTQNRTQNERTSLMTDNQFSTVLGVAHMTQGSAQNAAVGRYYFTVDDGNIENYLEMQHCTIKKFKVWFTYPDGTLIYWTHARPILELYIID
jgi:hypothetical protein